MVVREAMHMLPLLVSPEVLAVQSKRESEIAYSDLLAKQIFQVALYARLPTFQERLTIL